MDCLMSKDTLQAYLKGNVAYFNKKNILWMKTIQYPNTLRSHLVTVVPMAPFTPKFTSKLDLLCTLDIRKSFHASFPSLILLNL